MARENAVAEALRDVFISPNECDSNFEPANVTDGLYAIARAVRRLAQAVEGLSAALNGREPNEGR